jgi:hypothetical protein
MYGLLGKFKHLFLSDLWITLFEELSKKNRWIDRFNASVLEEKNIYFSKEFAAYINRKEGPKILYCEVLRWEIQSMFYELELL